MNLGADGVISVASPETVMKMFEMLDAIEHNDIKNAALSMKFIPKSMRFSLTQASSVRLSLITLGFAAGPTRLPRPAPEDAKRIVRSWLMVTTKQPKRLLRCPETS